VRKTRNKRNKKKKENREKKEERYISEKSQSFWNTFCEKYCERFCCFHNNQFRKRAFTWRINSD